MTHRCMLAILLLACTAAVEPAAAQHSAPPAGASFYRLRARADEALAAGRHQDAAALFGTLSDAQPENGELWVLGGRALAALGDVRGAAASYRRGWAGGAWPRGEVAYAIARLHARLGERDAALAWVDTALAHRLENRSRMQADSAFAAYHDDARFRRQAAMLPAGPVSREEGWRHDIALFVEEARRLHVALERPAFSEEFASAAEALGRDVERLSDAELGVGLYRLAARLGDGHSYLVPRVATVPVQFYAFSDGVFVVEGSGAGAPLVGSRLLRIGRVSADSAMRVTAREMPKDNETTPLWLGVQLLTIPALLHAFGLSDDPARLSLEVADRGGRTRRVVLEPDTGTFARNLVAPRGATAPPPLWLSRVDEPHWLTPLPEMRAVYAQYNQVRDGRQQTVAQFAERVTRALRESGATSLIVDVRHNNGGRRTLNTPLLNAMAAFRHAAAGHQVFIITGRGTFSAAQLFIAQAEWMADPIFVGEPSSSRPNFVGEESGVVLPYSRARGSVSSQYHQGTTWQDARPFIAPHVPVALSSADYFANRDPALEAIRDLLRSEVQPAP